MPNPTNPQALNRYSYVFNNPIKFADPTGFAPCIIDNGERYGSCGANDPSTPRRADVGYSTKTRGYFGSDGGGRVAGSPGGGGGSAANAPSGTVAHWGWVPGDAGGWQRGWVYYSEGSGAGGSGGGKGKARAPTIQDHCRSHAHTCGNANQPVGGGGGAGKVIATLSGGNGRLNQPCQWGTSLACDLSWLIPSHFGLRGQLEPSGNLPLPMLGNTGPGVSGAVGFNIAHNHLSQQFGANIDFTLAGTYGLGGGSGAVSIGPLVGWGASNLDQIVSGNAWGYGLDAFALLGGTHYQTRGSEIDPYSLGHPLTIFFGVTAGIPYNLSGGVGHT